MNLMEAMLTRKINGKSGASVLEDLLDDSIGFEKGYLASDGNIANQGSVTKEMTSDFIPLPTDGAVLFVVYHMTQVPSDNAPWTAVMYYDDSKAKLGSRIADSATVGGRVTADGGATVLFPFFEPPTEAAYVRFSLRTFGSTAVRVLQWKDTDIREELAQVGRQLSGG